MRETGKGDPPNMVWYSLSSSAQRSIQLSVSAGFVLLITAQLLLDYNQFLSETHIEPFESAPMIGSAIFLFFAVVASTLYTATRQGAEWSKLAILGSWWILSVIPLMLDYFLDNFEGKLFVMILFFLVGLGYWKGRRNTTLGFVVSLLTVGLIAGDGSGHLQGAHCVSTGFASCPVKLISDAYLLVLLIPLTFATIKMRTERPNILVLLPTVALAVLISLGFGLARLFGMEA